MRSAVELHVTRLTFPGDQRSIRPYLGIGAFGSFKIAEDIAETRGFQFNYRTEQRMITWGAGLFGVFGVEWRFRSNVALHGEYGQGFRYRPGRVVVDYFSLDASGATVNQSRSDRDSGELSIYSIGSRAGVSIFF